MTPNANYKGKTLEEIINFWGTELENDAVRFSKSAKKVSEWDGVLRDSTRSISELTDNVSRLLGQQEELDNTLKSVSDYQKEMAGSIDSMESNIDTLFEAHGSEQPLDCDLQREQAYQRSIEVDLRLTNINSSMNSIVNDLNGASEKAGGGGNSNLSQILMILNAHYETLSWLEASSKNIENNIGGGGG